MGLYPVGTTLEELVANVSDRAPAGSVIVGYSMGGRVALHAALGEPERYSALVLVGVSAGIENPADRAARRRADEALAAWMESRAIEEVVARWEGQPVFATQPPELVAAQRVARLGHDPLTLAALLRGAGQGASPPVWDRLPELGIPVLALAGELDETYAAAAKRMAALLPQGRARLVGNAGHAAHLEAPAALADLLGEFLDEHFPQGPGAHVHP